MSPAPEPTAAAARAECASDVALALALGLVLLGWSDGFLWASALGPWWSLIWLGPVVYAARRTWRAPRRHGPRRAWVPLALYLALAAGECALVLAQSGPWWLTHVVLGAALLALALRRRPHAWFAPRLAALTLAVLALPWIPTPEPHAFWRRCARLRPGMSVDEVLALFGDAWVQQRDTQDGCARTPVAELRPADWRDDELITFYPLDGEHCSADLCWTEFEHGRLVGYSPSPD